MKKSLKSAAGSAKSCPASLTCNNKPRNTKTGSIKSGKISKYFAPIPSDDFDSPYKDLLSEQKPILNDSTSEDNEFKTPKFVKTRSKPKLTKPASKNVRKGAANKSKTRQRTLTKMIEDQLTCGDTNAEHLQMAIQLSKSEQLTESVDQETSNFSVGLSTQDKIVNVKATLEKFGFKSRKQTSEKNFESTRRPKNSNFRCVTPVLFLRNEVDRQVIIAEKISSITTQSTPPISDTTNFIYFLTSSYLQSIQYFGPKYFHRNNIEHDDSKPNQRSDFYVKTLNIPESEVICGSLLKDWHKIAGRDKSPIRVVNKTIISDVSKENDIIDNLSYEKSTGCISPDLFDSDDDCGVANVENLNDSVHSSLEMINQPKQSQLSDESNTKKRQEICDTGIEYFESFNDDVECLSMSLTQRYNEKFDVSEDSDILNFNNTLGDKINKNHSRNIERNKSIKEYVRPDISIEFTEDNPSVELTKNESEICENKDVESERKDLNVTEYIQNMLTQDFFDSNIIDLNDKSADGMDLTQSSDESLQNGDEIQHNLEDLSEKLNNSLTEDFIDSNFINSNNRPGDVLDLTLSSDESMPDESQHNLEDLSEKINDTSFTEDFFGSNINNSNDKPADMLDLTQSSDESIQEEIQNNLEELSEKINDNTLTEDFFHSNVNNSNHKPADVLDFSSDESVHTETKHNLEELSEKINKNSLTEDFFVSKIINSNDKQAGMLNLAQSSDELMHDGVQHNLEELSEKINNNSLTEDFFGSNINNSKDKSADMLDLTQSSDESIQDGIQHNLEELSENINDNTLTEDFFGSNANNSNNKPADVLDLSSDESVHTETQHNLEELSEKINKNNFFDSNIINSNDKPESIQNEMQHNLEELSERTYDNSFLVDDLITKPLQMESSKTIKDYSPKKFKKSISFDYYKTEIVKPTPRKTVRKSLTFSSLSHNNSKLTETNDFRTSLESINDEELNYSSLFSTPFRKKHSEKTDVIIDLDSDEHSTENSNENSTENSTKTNKTPIVNKRLKQLTENHVFQTPTSTKTSCFSTPDGVIIKTRNVTPMPDYDRMNTPNILLELEKVGVKSLKRHRGVQILKHIYDATHPLLDEGRNSDDERIVKRRKSVTFTEVLASRVEDIQGDTAWQAKGSFADVVGSFPESEELFFERRQSAKILSCAVPLHIAWHNFLAGNPELQENILLYEPLQLEVLYAMMKENGHKYHIQDLITFLDKKCITIRINQNNGQTRKKKIVKNKSN